MSTPLHLGGLHGGNPLAFLAFLGCVSLTSRFQPEARFSWVRAESGWQPRVHGFEGGADAFAGKLHQAMRQTPPTVWEIDKKMPFPRENLRGAMRQAAAISTRDERHDVDLLAGMGSDAHADKNLFLDTSLRMVRSGDSNGQGFPCYARAIQKAVTSGDLEAALFSPWRYEDDGYSLRWDPVEDQRYALRWYDPSPQANKKYALRSVRGANALAVEALALLPVQAQAGGVATTGFTRLEKRRDFFTWPIWETPVSRDVIRSLLALSELALPRPPREVLHARGLVEVYRCERIALNQYYKNFAPAQPA